MIRKIFIIIIFLGSFCTALAFSDEKNELSQELSRSVSKDGSVIAIWSGKDPRAITGNTNTPLSFGVEKLMFRFSSDGKQIEFKPNGDLYFDCWSFNIFDGNGRYVVLLQDHYGPYHVIKIENLRDYLDGKIVPYEVVEGKDPESNVGVVHGRPQWNSKDTFRFTAACCGRKRVVTHKIGSKTMRGKWEKVYKKY